MTKTEMAVNAALYHLKIGPMTCSNLGVQLWGNGHRKPQSYARPAGKLLRHMQYLGLVRTYFDKFHQHFVWALTPTALAKCRKD
jgi:hypothetical protein